jgi:predicted transporter
MFIGLLLLLGDLGVIAGLVIAVVMAARRLLPSQLARPGVSACGRWMALIAAVTVLGLDVAGNA